MLDRVQSAVDQILSPLAHFVYLLGSAGTDRFRDDSDIDLAVLFKMTPTFDQLSDLKSKLEDNLGRDVDLVSLGAIDPIFGHQVLSSGRTLFVGSPGELLNWKVQQMSIYPDFKMSREGIEKSLLNRKKYV